MIGTLNRVDPKELNRGQVIHFDRRNSTPSSSKSKSYDDTLADITNVEKKRVDNVVFCDWFEITIQLQKEIIFDETLSHIELSEGLILVPKQGRTKTYNHVWDVIYLGECFGTLMTGPAHGYMDSLYAQFKVENRILYRCDWLDDVKHILSSCRSKWISNTRIDISLDGTAGTKAKSIVKRHLSGSVIGRKGKALISIGRKRDKTIARFHVGGTKSDKSATIYHKSNDIEQTGKTYISEAWKHNGLESTADVERFEIRMKSKVANKYDWTKFDDANYLSSIVRTECKNWFEFYYDGKDKNRYRLYKNNTMEWVDWESIEGKLLPKSKAIAITGMGRAKRIIKDLTYMRYVEKKRVPLRIIEEMKEDYCLTKWYNDKIDYWQMEWDREIRFKNISSN